MLCETIKDLNEIKLENYIAEQKFDGERIVIGKKGSNIEVINRRGNIKNDTYIEIVEELSKLDFDFMIDGEVCSTDGLFNSLQKRALLKDEGKIAIRTKEIPVLIHIFDILSIGAEDLRFKPLMERKKVLDDNFGKLNLRTAKVCGYVEGEDNIKALWETIKAEKKEGIVLKLKNSVYVGKRSRSWCKFKNFKEETITFNVYEQNNAGVKLSDGFNECQVAGHERAKWIVQKLKDEKKIEVVVQYLEKTADGKMRFPSCKEVIGYE